MQLEDHIGDVIAKERFHQKIPPGTVAEAAGLSASELSEFEETGRISKPLNYDSIAKAIGLNAAKLKGIADGWTPKPTDLSRWRELRCITTDQGMAVNCYLAWDEVTREAALFDTGWSADPIFKIIDEEQLNLTHLFITHTHTDHIAAMEEITGRYPKLRIHTDAKSAPVHHKNRRNDCVQLGSLRITNRVTTGHAADGVTYIVGNWPEDAPHAAIVGDAIFSGSIGRGNISGEEAKQTAREAILSLPDDTLICPGHGPLTTVAEEKEHNPFF